MCYFVEWKNESFVILHNDDITNVLQINTKSKKKKKQRHLNKIILTYGIQNMFDIFMFCQYSKLIVIYPRQIRKIISYIFSVSKWQK